MKIEYGELKQAYSELIFGWQDLPIRDWRQGEAEKNAGVLSLIQEWEEQSKQGGQIEYRKAEFDERGGEKERRYDEETGKKDRFYGSRSFPSAGHFNVEGRGRGVLGTAGKEAVFRNL